MNGRAPPLLAWLDAAQSVVALNELAATAQAGLEGASAALTYGETPLAQLSALFDVVRQHGGLQAGGGRRDTFVDLGCGGGKLVLGAALNPSFRVLLGIEMLPSLVREAQSLHTQMLEHLTRGKDADAEVLQTAERAQFICADLLDLSALSAAGAVWWDPERDASEPAEGGGGGGCHIVFVNSLCFPARLTRAICGRIATMPCNTFIAATTELPWAQSGMDTMLELLYTNADDPNMDFIAMAMGDDAAGANFWDDFVLYLWRKR